MLKNDDIYSEIEALDAVIEDLKSPYERSMLKSQTLVLKLLHNVRTNQTLLMKSQGVELRKPKTTEEPTTK
jgi:hypothetical protein